MKCHRIEELLELLEPEWQKDQEMNLLQFIVKLAQEAGYDGKLEDHQQLRRNDPGPEERPRR